MIFIPSGGGVVPVLSSGTLCAHTLLNINESVHFRVVLRIKEYVSSTRISFCSPGNCSFFLWVLVCRFGPPCGPWLGD